MSDLAPTRTFYETREICHRDVYKHLAMLRKSLLELKLFSKKALLENTLYWQKEIEKVKLQKDQEWQERISKTEAENKRLRAIIENIGNSDESKRTHEVCLWKAENQVDHLSRQLDKKLIHINKLQLALAEQSKGSELLIQAMFEVEKSYVLLYRQYVKVRRKENGALNSRTEAKSENS